MLPSMRSSRCLLILLVAASSLAASSSPQLLEALERETVQQAAGVVKHLVHSSVTGTLASTFSPHDLRTPSHPYAIMEYHAPCHPTPSLTFLLFPESVSTRNILASKEHLAGYTLSMPIQGVRSPVARARVSFMGNMTILNDLSDEERTGLEECYKSYHPDVFWFPGSESHPWDSMWARFDPADIYYVGGFGDTHYIGHIPIDVYASAEAPPADVVSAPPLTVQAEDISGLL